MYDVKLNEGPGRETATREATRRMRHCNFISTGEKGENQYVLCTYRFESKTKWNLFQDACRSSSIFLLFSFGELGLKSSTYHT
jgi:hypothetical protein